MANDNDFAPASKNSKHPLSDRFCPICGDDKGRCGKLIGKRPGSPLDQPFGYLCRGGHTGYHPDYVYLRPCKGNSYWSYWYLRDTSDKKIATEDLERFHQQRLEKKRERARQMLPIPSRHAWYSTLLEDLELEEPDRNDLIRRGLSDDHIAAGLFRSVGPRQSLRKPFPPNLPGVDPISRLSLLNGHSGYLVPVVNVRQQVVGCQLRLRQGDDQRYRWLSSSWAPGGQGQATPNGETPLTVRLPIGDYDRSVVGFCEGLGVKPFAAAQRLGITMIGTSSASWTSSENTLLGSIDILSPERFELFPDAGMVLNSSILTSYESLIGMIEEIGKPITIGWWGQAHKLDGDIDEIEKPSNVVQLNPKDFWAEVKQSSSQQYLSLAEASGERPISGSAIERARHYEAMQRQRQIRALTLNVRRRMAELSIDWGHPAILSWFDYHHTCKEKMVSSKGTQLSFYEWLNQWTIAA
jgi:hypothetical protein